ncbi:MAG: cytochrome c [Bacteroidota bacterium]
MKLQDEIDWNDLRRKPEKLFGYSYLYFLVVLAALGMLYVGNLTTTGKNSIIPGVPVDSSSLLQELQLQSPRVLPAVDVLKYGTASPELVQKGEDLFKQNCSSCHGDNGDGNGPTAATLASKPRNFHSLDGWKNGSKVSQIYTTLETGLQGTAMSSFNYLTPADRFAIIHFVRSLAPNQPVDSTEELKQLDARYELAKGVNVAGQIPVKKAMKIIENENQIKGLNDAVQYMQKSEKNVYPLLLMETNDLKRIWSIWVLRHEQPFSLNELIHIISADPKNAGFKTEVLRFNKQQWTMLLREINNLPKPIKGKDL